MVRRWSVRRWRWAGAAGGTGRGDGGGEVCRETGEEMPAQVTTSASLCACCQGFVCGRYSSCRLSAPGVAPAMEADDSGCEARPRCSEESGYRQVQSAESTGCVG